MNIKIFLAGCFFGMSALSVEAQQVWTPDNGDGTFTNPIMWGDWPDPDVIRVGDDFYFVSTSMHYVPGCPIAKSKDLVNWEMVGYAVDRYDDDPRYDLKGGNLYLNGSWASSIRHHNGKFYVAFCTPYGWGTEKGHFSVWDRGGGLFFPNIFMVRDCCLTMMEKCMSCTVNISCMSRN